MHLLDLQFGLFFVGLVGNYFLGKVGGEMHNLDLVGVNHSLVKGIQLVAAVQRLLGPKSDVKDELMMMGREFRLAAAECQRVLKHMEENRARLLLVQDRGAM